MLAVLSAARRLRFPEERAGAGYDLVKFIAALVVAWVLAPIVFQSLEDLQQEWHELRRKLRSGPLAPVRRHRRRPSLIPAFRGLAMSTSPGVSC